MIINNKLVLRGRVNDSKTSFGTTDTLDRDLLLGPGVTTYPSESTMMFTSPENSKNEMVPSSGHKGREAQADDKVVRAGSREAIESAMSKESPVFGLGVSGR